jgi:hypothetical protein
MTKKQRGAILRTGGAYDSLDARTMSVGIGAATPLWQGHYECIEVIVQNGASGGQNTVLVGNANRQTFELASGASLTIPICDASLVYINSPNGTATINWIAMR